jgi:hypothetical protein
LIFSPAFTFAAMRSARVNVPQSRVKLKGAPSAFSPVSGIWVSLNSWAETAPPRAMAATAPSNMTVRD